MPIHQSTSNAGTSASHTADIIGSRWSSRALGSTQALNSRWATAASSSASSNGWSTARAGQSQAAAASTTANVNTPSPTLRALELDKIKRLIDRLMWKSTLLCGSQNLALSATASSADIRDTYGGGAEAGPSRDAERANDADIDARPMAMFKLDFYEWYVLLERILVLLLAFFNVSVPRGRASGSPSGRSGLKDSAHAATASRAANGSWAHRYHVNVLKTLDKTNNPLHPVLGTDPIRGWLWKAKEFRNRWKGADEIGSWSVEEQRAEILDLSIESMLSGILETLESAHCVAVQKANIGTTGTAVFGNGAGGSGSGSRIADEDMDMDMDDAPWEAVDDAMDMEMS
ncbi:hypothetical protein K490DRAFT_58434 [Saccharata proteae CBS 121410]|uniref:Uncharacterized protein n=1 Tax=Saccharata proteae CBS 121410 TaxID=1314787 RepID=A0A9P4HQ40_9PEZI|nr:hypothetical protein K490DRAFT_58434 [Saccharata proteae CBS 121410]